jgi:hypothetical protein
MLPGESEFLQALTSITVSPIVEEYRAYYDADGWVTGFSGSGFPDTDNWINISREIYVTHDWSCMRVVDGKIFRVEPVYFHHFALTRSNKGVRVVKGHAGIVIEDDYLETEYYERRNR